MRFEKFFHLNWKFKSVAGAPFGRCPHFSDAYNSSAYQADIVYSGTRSIVIECKFCFHTNIRAKVLYENQIGSQQRMKQFLVKLPTWAFQSIFFCFLQVHTFFSRKTFRKHFLPSEIFLTLNQTVFRNVHNTHQCEHWTVKWSV